MLEKIKLKNFRKHRHKEIKFSPKITTIIGTNRSGKSTILRALFWLAKNRPLGNSFIKHGKNKSTVSLFVDGKKIVRSKGRGANSYRIGDKKLKAFRDEVPSEVAKLLNISSLNFQNQHDSPFWLSETAGEVSRQLNKIVNLDVIDKILYNLAAQIRKAKVKIDIIKATLAKVKQQRKELAFIKEMNGDLVTLEQLDSTIQETTLKATTIRNLIELGSKYRQAQEKASIAVAGGKKAVLRAESYQDISSKIQLLYGLTTTGYELQKTIDSNPPSIKPLKRLKKALENVTSKYFNLQSLIKLAKDSSSNMRLSTVECKMAKQQFESEIGKTCPLCDSPIKKK